MVCRLDHIVVGAATLEEGEAYVHDAFGVDLSVGGEHVHMGTHNRLMQLGNNSFLEIIAISPTLAAPQRPRWFGLDDPHVRRRLQAGPQLLTWVVNCDDLSGLIDSANFELGESTALSRGELSWNFAVPSDGRLHGGGLLPYAMQWNVAEHPSSGMPELGCTLVQLDIYHRDVQWINEALTSFDSIAERVKIHAISDEQSPYMVASIDTATGRRLLGGQS